MNLQGYVFSRPFMGERVPQHVQNIVIRDYCERYGFHYLLSATEYAMENCHLILSQVLDDLNQIDGIVAYSLFQLPEVGKDRQRVYAKIMSLGKCMHFAVEGLNFSNEGGLDSIESMWRIRKTLSECPQTIIWS
jgi:sporadic carbohydrate cluster protein (TIGR04323 family)